MWSPHVATCWIFLSGDGAFAGWTHPKINLSSCLCASYTKFVLFPFSKLASAPLSTGGLPRLGPPLAKTLNQLDAPQSCCGSVSRQGYPGSAPEAGSCTLTPSAPGSPWLSQRGTRLLKPEVSRATGQLCAFSRICYRAKKMGPFLRKKSPQHASFCQISSSPRKQLFFSFGGSCGTKNSLTNTSATAAVFTLVPSTSKFSRILTSTSKFNLTPKWWASENGPDRSLMSSSKK